MNTAVEMTALAEETIEVSVVMPCLNEAETLATCIRKAQAALQNARIPGEIVIGDNGSTDGSQEIASACGARVINVKQKGYGNALRGGIAAAKGKYVIMGDADDSYDFSHIPRFLAELRSGSDLVMGNRFKGGIAPHAMPPLHRYLGNPVLTFLGRMLFRSPCGDFHCGLRGFAKNSYQRMDLRSPGMEFASEMVVKASLLGLRVSEVPTTLSPDGRSRPPHLRTWRDGWRHLRFLLLYSPRWLFFYPGIALMVVGCLVSGWLIRGPQRLGEVTFDVDTLVYAAISILLGFQMVTIAFFARVFAASEGLLPPSRRTKKLLSGLSLEAGLITGALIFVAGLALSIYAVKAWSTHHFGPLDSSQMLRLTLPATVAMTLGLQFTASSFFLGLLSMKRQSEEG